MYNPTVYIQLCLSIFTRPQFSIPVYHAFFLLPPLLGKVLLIQQLGLRLLKHS